MIIVKNRVDYNDIVGKTLGRLTIISYDGEYAKEGNKTKKHYYKATCSCGSPEIIIAERFSILKSKCPSCGCYLKESNKTLYSKENTIGLTHSPIYKSYYSMMKRCYNPKDKSYQRYGERGITVCDEWLDKERGFINFYNWAMENGYREDLTIDRINVNGNYEPSNCRWATDLEQARNKRNNVFVNYKGENILLVELLDKFNLQKHYSGIYQRIFIYGWSVESAIYVPIGKGVAEYMRFFNIISEIANNIKPNFRIRKVTLQKLVNIDKITLRKYLKNPQIINLLDKFNIKVSRYFLYTNNVNNDDLLEVDRLNKICGNIDIYNSQKTMTNY